MKVRNDDASPVSAIIGISLTLLFGGLVLYLFCHAGCPVGGCR